MTQWPLRIHVTPRTTKSTRLFIIGIFLPLFWIIGAIMPPKAGRA